MEEERIDPGHGQRRSSLRVLGIVLLAAGILLLVFGVIRMFSPAWTNRPDPSEGFMEGRRSFDEVSRGMKDDFHDKARTSFTGFGMAAAGMVTLFAGVVLTGLGYMGKVQRYTAAEVAPPAGDTINYMADKVQPAIREISQAVAQGISGAAARTGTTPAQAATATRCLACQAENPAGARFCARCGAAMTAGRACATCGHVNPEAGKFCTQCGGKLG